MVVFKTPVLLCLLAPLLAEAGRSRNSNLVRAPAPVSCRGGYGGGGGGGCGGGGGGYNPNNYPNCQCARLYNSGKPT